MRRQQMEQGLETRLSKLSAKLSKKLSKKKSVQLSLQLAMQLALQLGQSSRRLMVLTSIALLSSIAQADLALNGSSIYSDLGTDQFAAALYLETRQQNSQVIQSMPGEKRMEVRILNNYSKRRWFNLWMQSISINNSRENFADSAEDLVALMQAPKSAPQKGDLVEYISSHERGTSMRFNGTELIAGLSSEVFDLLLYTWIGAIPPTTVFKDEILGLRSNVQATRLLTTVNTAPERVALAASWMAPAKPKLAAAPKPTLAETEKAQQTASVTPEDVAPKAATVATIAPPVSSDQEAIPAQPPQSEDQLGTTAQLAAGDGDAINETEESVNPESAPRDDIDADDDIDFSVEEALAMRDYTPVIVQKIFKKITYPGRAIDRGQEGTVRMEVLINKQGVIEKVTVTQKSRYSALNKAAVRAVERAAPFPNIPDAINVDFFELTVPITFKLK